MNDLVAAIAGHVSIRPSIRKVPLPEARQKMGAYADALALDQIVRCPRARALGWTPSLHAVSRNAARLFEEWRRARKLHRTTVIVWLQPSGGRSRWNCRDLPLI